MTYPIELKKDDRPGKAVQWIGADGGMKTGTRLVETDLRPYPSEPIEQP